MTYQNIKKYNSDHFYISIIIPCFNSVKFITEAVISACEQNYGHFEVLVIDNCSTDGTSELLHKLQTEYDFVLLENEKNFGAIENFNIGIENARGQFIKFLESDDILEKNCLSIMASHLNYEVEFVCASKQIIDAHSYVVGKHILNEDLKSGLDIIKSFRKSGNIIGTPTDCLISKRLLNFVGGFSLKYGDYLNDLDVWLKICSNDVKIKFISEIVCKVRRHDDQIGMIGRKSLKDLQVAFQMLEEKYFIKQRFSMEVHFGAAYLYRSIRECFKGDFRTLSPTVIMLLRMMRINMIWSVLYLPLYFYYLQRAKR